MDEEQGQILGKIREEGCEVRNSGKAATTAIKKEDMENMKVISVCEKRNMQMVVIGGKTMHIALDPSKPIFPRAKKQDKRGGRDGGHKDDWRAKRDAERAAKKPMAVSKTIGTDGDVITAK